jgi:hypothetical protein
MSLARTRPSQRKAAAFHDWGWERENLGVVGSNGKNSELLVATREPEMLRWVGSSRTKKRSWGRHQLQK